MSAPKKKPYGFTIADCSFDGTPRCGHCGEAFLSSTPVTVRKGYIVVHCERHGCGCETPFRRTAA
jgi:hypothetical protein